MMEKRSDKIAWERRGHVLLLTLTQLGYLNVFEEIVLTPDELQHHKKTPLVKQSIYRSLNW